MNGDTRGGKSVNAGSRIASNRTDDSGSAGGMGGGLCPWVERLSSRSAWVGGLAS
jgi:hypothetical protein